MALAAQERQVEEALAVVADKVVVLAVVADKVVVLAVVAEQVDKVAEVGAELADKVAVQADVAEQVDKAAVPGAAAVRVDRVVVLEVVPEAKVDSFRPIQKGND